MDRIPLTGPFRMTDALRRTFTIVGSELRTLVPLVLLIHLPVILLAAGFLVWLRDDPNRFFEQQGIYSILQMPIALIAKLLATGALMPAVFARLRGDHVTAGEALRHVFGRFLPLLGLGVTVGLGVWLGSFACGVPGIMLYVATYVAIPSLMVEDTGVEASWRRSFALTAGYRWEVFGLVFVLWMVSAVFAFGATAFSMAGIVASETSMGSLVAMQALSQLAALVGTLLTAVAATVTYHDLRVTKEGISEEDLLEVFA
jgi:hypothetical protein